MGVEPDAGRSGRVVSGPMRGLMGGGGAETRWGDREIWALKVKAVAALRCATALQNLAEIGSGVYARCAGLG
jgi:hypothetical protein